MQAIKNINAIKSASSNKCKTLENLFKDEDINLGIATNKKIPKKKLLCKFY